MVSESFVMKYRYVEDGEFFRVGDVLLNQFFLSIVCRKMDITVNTEKKCIICYHEKEGGDVAGEINTGVNNWVVRKEEKTK